MSYKIQHGIRCVIMRAGTSKGIFLRHRDLPQGLNSRNRAILRLFGSPDVRQIDGLGGADPLTSKVAIISPPTRKGADVDYTFGQVSQLDSLIDYNGNCGNIISGVGPFAIDEGLVSAVEPITTVRIHNTNTNTIIIARVPVCDGYAAISGNTSIAGVPGSGARIELDFSDSAGKITGKFLPLGCPVNWMYIDGIKVRYSVIDAGTPTVFVYASDIGLLGTETPQQIENNQELLDRIEKIRGTVAVNLELVTTWEDAAKFTPYLPFLSIVSPPTDDTMDLNARLVFMQRVHKAYPGTGTVATGSAAKIKDTIVHKISKSNNNIVRIGHPSGVISINVDIAEGCGHTPRLRQARFYRTARRLMEGTAFLPPETI